MLVKTCPICGSNDLERAATEIEIVECLSCGNHVTNPIIKRNNAEVPAQIEPDDYTMIYNHYKTVH